MRRVIAALLLLAIAPTALADSAVPDLHPFVRGSWKQLLAEHLGTPIVIHFWDVTCGPCIAELPVWEAFRQKMPDLHLVLINTAVQGDDPANAAAVLKRDGLVGAENWIFADRFEERLRFEIDRKWHGELPYTVLLARDGTTTTFVGTTDFPKLRHWLAAQDKRS